jgi:hypothetical protein
MTIPRSRTRRTATLAGIVLLSAAVLAMPRSAPADSAMSTEAAGDPLNQCESLTGTVVRDWNQNVRPDIEAVMQGLQSANNLVTTTERTSVTAQTTRLVTGQTPSEIVGEVMETAVTFLTRAVSDGPWSNIGPRALELPGSARGRITPVVGTTRMFITPPNLTHGRTRITVTKLGGRQRAEIVVCKAPWDDPGNFTRVRVIEFDNGLANVGEAQSVVVSDAHGYYTTVKVRKFVGTNAFEYRVQAEPRGQSRLE